MAAVIDSPQDIVNLSLGRMGYKLRVGSLYEGSTAAKNALDIYGQTRDELLRQNDWAFAERNISLTLLKSAPIGGYFPPTVWTAAYPPPPWRFEYAYPTDCLKVRAVKPHPLFVPNFDPQPHLFGVANDNAFTPPQKVILSNTSDAVMVYTGQVTDPTAWETDFIEAIAAALARRLAPALVGMQAAQMLAGDEVASIAVAEKERG